MKRKNNERIILRKTLSIILTMAVICGSMISSEKKIAAEEEHVHNYVNGFCTVTDCDYIYQMPQGAGTEDNPYKISNAGELYCFVDIVDCKYVTNIYEWDDNVYGVLTKDIVVNEGEVTKDSIGVREWTPIGGKLHYFYCNFDGQYHTISGLYCNEPEKDAVGLFGKVIGCTIRNVSIENSYFEGKDYVGSICGNANWSAVVENCYSTAQVTGNSYVGGLIGNLHGVSSKLKNCYYAGNISGSSNTGGICGYMTTSVLTKEVLNCYYVNDVDGIGGGNTIIEEIVGCTEEEFASGKIAYELNKGIGKKVFGQTLSGENVSVNDVQTTPVFGGAPVYASGTAKCPGTKITYTGFCNDAGKELIYEYPNHDYSNGFCSICDGYEKPEGDGSSNSPYEIGNAGELYYFAGIVNGNPKICTGGVSGNRYANGVLTDDIVVNAGKVKENSTGLREWTPIGDGTSFSGSFNGNQHIISGLFVHNDQKIHVGVFSYLDGGRVYNLGIENSFFKGKSHVGGISGIMRDATIRNCYSKAKVEGNSFVGGFTGHLNGNASVLTHCYFAGSVSGFSYTGAICGYLSHSIPEGRVYGCYYLSDSGLEAIGKENESADAIEVIGKTSEEFASGEVTFALNEGAGERVFGQRLSGENVAEESVQSMPVLGGVQVYADGMASCPGAEITFTGFSNEDGATITYNYPEHDYQNGICTMCDGYHIPEGSGSKIDPYKISNAGELYYFANIVNGNQCVWNDGIENDQYASAILTEDIIVNAGVVTEGSVNVREWTPIGSTRFSYKGVFDGQQHTISGLYYNNENKGAVGLFGYVENGCTIGNLGVINSYMSAYGNVGGICGYGKDAVIENCYSNVQLKGERFIGGIVGRLDGTSPQMRNCYAVGDVSGASAIGGICGYLHTNVLVENIVHCYCLSGASVTVIGDGKTNVDTVIAMSMDEFSNGKVAWLLDTCGGTKEHQNIWGQNTALPAFVNAGSDVYYQVQMLMLDGTVKSYLVSKNADLLLANTEGIKWVYNGHQNGYLDGADYVMGTKLTTDITLKEVSETSGVATSVMKGDVDDNKEVTLTDAQMTLKAALKIISLDEKQEQAADVDGETGVTLSDAQMILKYALNIINKFE